MQVICTKFLCLDEASSAKQAPQLEEIDLNVKEVYNI